MVLFQNDVDRVLCADALLPEKNNQLRWRGSRADNGRRVEQPTDNAPLARAGARSIERKNRPFRVLWRETSERIVRFHSHLLLLLHLDTNHHQQRNSCTTKQADDDNDDDDDDERTLTFRRRPSTERSLSCAKGSRVVCMEDTQPLSAKQPFVFQISRCLPLTNQIQGNVTVKNIILKITIFGSIVD